jgi:hypothetical protein
MEIHESPAEQTEDNSQSRTQNHRPNRQGGIKTGIGIMRGRRHGHASVGRNNDEKEKRKNPRN